MGDDPTRTGPAHDDPTVAGSARPPRPESTQRFQAGQVLGERYRIVSSLGGGAMGEVYRAEDLVLGETVALKFLPAALGHDERWLAQLRDEVRHARRVTHPNVCRVYDLAQVDDEWFISMEYVDGEDLATLLRRIGRLPEPKALEIAHQLCGGLAAAHARGILHRDLKPANVMLDGAGMVRITDFGLAAPIDAASARDRAGTPAYMAPEQREGREVSERSDVYGLGLVLLELFTGHDVVTEGLIGVGLQLPQDASRAAAAFDGIDPTVETVVLRCLERDPSRRPGSAATVAAALPGGDPLAAALAMGRTPSPDVVAAAGGSERMSAVAVLTAVTLIAAGLVVATVVTAVASLHGQTRPPKSPPVLVDRARAALDQLGLPSVFVHEAWGFESDGAYLRWLASGDQASDRWERLRSSPSAMRFWFRGSPASLAPQRGGLGANRTGPTDPTWTTPGEVFLSLDLDGHVLALHSVPGHVLELGSEATERTDPTEAVEAWSAVRTATGLDEVPLEPVEPHYRTPFRTDARHAWTGVDPATGTTIRLEAARLDDVISMVRVLGPWNTASAGVASEAGSTPGPLERVVLALRAAITSVGLTIVVGLILGSGLLTYLNARRGRGDWRSAARLGVYVLLTTLLLQVVDGHGLIPRTEDAWMRRLGAPALLGVCAFSCYFGLDPFLRRRWPTMLIASTRLLNGRIGDPLVGRSVLIGVLAGILMMVLLRLTRLAPAWAGDAPPIPIWNDFNRSLALRDAVAGVLTGMSIPILIAFAYLLLLVLLRVVLRSSVAAGVLFVVFVMFVEAPALDVMPWSVVASAARAGILLALFLRLGVLSVAVALAVNSILNRALLTTDLQAWYATPTYVAWIAVVGLAGWGALAAGGWRRRPPAPRHALAGPTS